MLQQVQSSGMFTGPTEASMDISRVSPQDEAGAYGTAYGGLMGDIEGAYAPTQAPGFGALPESQVSGYFDLAQPYMFGRGMEQINAQLGEAGFAPSGTGGVGPQAEMAARLRSQMGVQQGQALLANAATGQAARTQGAFGRAQARTGAAGQVGASRYAALTRPNAFSIRGQSGGAGASVQQHSPWASMGGGGGVGPDRVSTGPSAGDIWNAAQLYPIPPMDPTASQNPYPAGSTESGWWGDEYQKQMRKPQPSPYQNMWSGGFGEGGS